MEDGVSDGAKTRGLASNNAQQPGEKRELVFDEGYGPVDKGCR